LVYEGEEDHPYLKRVVQEDGRWLQINWANYNGQAVIGSVQTGSAGSQQVVQQVDYGYSGSGSSFILRQVFYNDTPAIGQAASAIYDYQPNVLSGPSLKRADDPTFAGAMTKIGYNYYGQACSLPTPVPTPVEIHDWYDFLPEAITAETSGETGQMVAGFRPVCHDGTRTDFNGLGGWRTLYYGGSAQDSEIGVNLGHSLTKVTDFAKENTPTSGVPARKQNGAEPSKVWDGRHIRTELTYDDSGGVASIHHPSDGSTATYDRVDPSNLSGSLTPDWTRMHNRQHHWLFKKRDELGNVTVYRRDERRRVTDIYYYNAANTLVASETYSYNIWNQVETHRLASNAVETYEYDPATHLLIRESNNVDGPVKEYDYDGLGRIWRMRDARAIAEGATYTERMEYNGWHQITKIHYRATGGSSDPTVKYEYDNYGNRTAVIDELGHRKDYTYDSYRRCTSLTEQAGSSTDCNNVQVRQWNWFYDREIEYAPNDRRMFVASTHTSKEWRIQIEPEFNADHDRRATSRVFDVNNRMISESTGLIQKQGDALGTLQSVPGITEMHSVRYDDNGQKSTSTDPLQRVTSYEYDGRNRLKTTTGPSRLNQVNPVTTFDYDVAGNKTKVTLPGPEQYTQEWSDFDAFGQARTFTNENHKITNLTYKWGPMKKLETVRTYREMDDGAGQETQLTSFDYDGMGRLKKTVFPDTATVVSEESTYRFGQLETWKTRRNQTKRLFYDARGRESYHTWDNDAAPGITRVWDDANRLTSISNIFSTIDYGYDDAGQVKWEGNSVAGTGRTEIRYCRYPSGEVSQITYPNGTVINRFYTPRGQLKGVGWGVGSTSYEYNADGTVDLQAWDHVSTRYGYDGRGMVSSILHRNTAAGRDLARRDYWRDDQDRIVAWKRGIDNSLNWMEDGRGDRYEYDPEGQLKSASYRVANPESSPGVALRTDIFHYDELGNRVRGNHIASLGWMDIKRRNNGLNQYESWENDRPVTDPHHWGSGIFHDDNIPPPAPSPPPATPPPNPWVSPGNGVLMEDGYVVAGFNALNQPVGIWSFAFQNTANWMFFGYDPLGRCVKRWVGPHVNYQVPPANTNPATYYYYDGWNLVQEGPNGASADIVYVHGGRVDEIVASKAGGNWRQHHYDAGGNCILLTNSITGAILEQYDYDAFGRPYFYNAGGSGLGLSSPQGNRFLFTGREWIKELRLYDYRNRMYQPELGRFLQPDPVGLHTLGAAPLSSRPAFGTIPKAFADFEFNLYRYCHNDPVNKVDPMGLYVSGLTSWDGGDWLRGPTGMTTHDKDLINQARLTDFLNSVKPAAREAATASHSTNVEHGGALANTKKDPNDLAQGKMTASTEDVARNPQGIHGVMNQTDFEKKPLPPGHERVIGGYWGLARWERGFPYGDKHALWTKHWSAVLGVPRPEGQHGQPDVHVFQYRPNMAEPGMDEP